ncbi:inositol monophosphatase family protein [Streptomyces torulosus]|uniref:inositol monophosphatase family protein n=1 Tax=Streptomyces torulosus TaxID=68276 RepID=UPI0006EBD04E|nr:inositol monophosphatase family protein [Streptomyces torulosus]
MTKVPEPHRRQGPSALLELLAVAEEAVDEAVGWLASAGEEWSATRFKASGEEVTDADVEVEARVTRVLQARTPEIPVVGEESATAPDAPLPQCCWLLDPIDGTMNYTRGAPMYAISLAYAEEGIPLLGLVHAPSLRRRWSTGPAASSSVTEAAVAGQLPRAVVGVSGTGSGSAHTRRFLSRVQDEAYRLRMQGSMALDLVGVAEGWLDACVCVAPKPWDVAAGVALCRERGYAVLGAEGRTFSFDSPVLVAGDPALALADLWGGR